MFDDIIEQAASLQLCNDVLAGRLAPSLLFFGPAASGKCSAALELGRVLSCENYPSYKNGSLISSSLQNFAEENCTCPSCEAHRYLQHRDILVLGYRSFTAEILACQSVFLNNISANSAKILFIRSVRKLQLRFCEVLTENDFKNKNIPSCLQSLEENLNELIIKNSTQSASITKITGSIVKDVITLINDGIGGNIPVEQIRRAVFWCRLAPSGNRKTLIIENVDKLRDDAGNTLLKLLEEPPDTVNIVLTSQRREKIMSTLLSRLRPYRFLRRSINGEKEVLRRIFMYTFESNSENKTETTNITKIFSVNGKPYTAGSSLVSAWMESFVPQNNEKLYSLAAFFLASFARISASVFKKNNKNVPAFFIALGERYAPISDSAGFEKSIKIQDIVRIIIDKGKKFDDGSFSPFLNLCLDMALDAIKTDPHCIVHSDMLKKNIADTEYITNTLNINKTSALESLFFNLKKKLLISGMSGVFCGSVSSGSGGYG